MMNITILGTGSVKAAPVYGCDCSACVRALSSDEYRRKPASMLINLGEQNVLVDAGIHHLADHFPIGSLTCILLTHYHMDHVQGLFELRWGEGLTIPVIGPDDPDGCADLFKHPGILDFEQKTIPYEAFSLGPLQITPLLMNHSKLTHGYVIEHGKSRLAYLTDTCGLSDDVVHYLKQNPVDIAIIDCSTEPKPETPRNHNDFTMALEIHHAIKAKRSVLTHLGHTMDVWLEDNQHQLPENMSVAYDGLSFSL